MRKFAHIALTVSILKQGSRYVAYSPALDLSTSGRSEKETRKRFAEASLLFIEELIVAGTLGSVLRELGWKQTRERWMPPKVISQQAVNVRMPVAA